MPSRLYPLHLRPQTALTERVEGGLIIPNRVAVPTPAGGPLPTRPGDGIGIEGLVGQSINVQLPVQSGAQPVVTVIGEPYFFTFGVIVGQNLGGSSQGIVNVGGGAITGILVRPIDPSVRIVGTGAAPNLIEIQNPAWGLWPIGTQLDVEMHLVMVDADVSQVTSCKVNGVEAATGLLEDVNHFGLNFLQLGASATTAQGTLGVLRYVLVQFTDGTQQLWGIDEGAGDITESEALDETVDINGTEGLDWDWFPFVVPPIEARPTDDIGIEGLVDDWRGSELVPTISIAAAPLGSLNTWRFGYEYTLDGAFGNPISASSSFTSGFYIRGPNAGNPNRLGINGQEYDLGFDPTGVRMEFLVQTRMTAVGQMTTEVVTVNGADIFVPGQGQQGTPLTARLDGVSTGTVGAGILYHWQYQNLDSGDLVRFFIDEDTGAVLNNEPGDSVAIVGTMAATEGVDWEWKQTGPDIFAGLVSQADVNTRGRTDDLPFDHVSSLVATQIGNGGVSGTAAAAGGATGMRMVNTDGTLELTPPDLSFLTGDWTVSWRMNHEGGSIGRQSLGRIYSSADDDDAISVGRGQFQGTTVSMEIRTPAETSLNDPTTGLGSSQNIERVWTLTREGTVMTMYLDGVATSATGTFTANDFASYDGIHWGLPVGFNAAWGKNIGVGLWTGVWDRVLSLEEIELLDDTVNPFV